MEVQDWIKGIEGHLWENLDEDTLSLKTKVTEEWIMDPRNNASWLGLYERIVALFWVMKNLMGHILWECMQKEEGDDTMVQCW